MCPNQNLSLEDGYMLPDRTKVCRLSKRTEWDRERRKSQRRFPASCCAVVAEIYFLDWQSVQRSSQASQSAIARDKVEVK
jgi:hypothetical protein